MSQSLTTLFLQPDNPCNCTISLDGKPVYEVVTTHEPKTVTTVRNGAGEVIGSFEWRDVRSDVVTFGENGETMSSGDWLKKSHLPFKDGITFKNKQGKKFEWKGTQKGIQLFADHIHGKGPIARFRKSYGVLLDKSAGSPTRETVPAELIMDEEANAMRDEVVLSFILLEKDRRVHEEPAAAQGAFLGGAQGAMWSAIAS